MKNRKQCYKALKALVFSAVLFGGLIMDGGNVPRARAEGMEAVCTCGKKCSADEYDSSCSVCADGYQGCEYKADTTGPTVNAAVNNGLLAVRISDADSGVKAVYVNGYEFTELTGSVLNIRLQQFDSGYEYFTIRVVDNEGNRSDVYSIKNPYYKPSDTGSDDDPAGGLPISAGATNPGSAGAVVTEHVKTDSTGSTVSLSPVQEERAGAGQEEPGRGKEFYTIQAASGKVFYLIVDRNGNEEEVYFLTEITENDLLNVTSGNSETLPKNSAVAENAVPIEGNPLYYSGKTEPMEEGRQAGDKSGSSENMGDIEDVGSTGQRGQMKEAGKLSGYIFVGILAAAAVGGAYYFKTVYKKKEDFIEDEEEDEEDYEECEDEGEASEGSPDDDFFDSSEE